MGVTGSVFFVRGARAVQRELYIAGCCTCVRFPSASLLSIYGTWWISRKVGRIFIRENFTTLVFMFMLLLIFATGGVGTGAWKLLGSIPPYFTIKTYTRTQPCYRHRLAEVEGCPLPTPDLGVEGPLMLAVAMGDRCLFFPQTYQLPMTTLRMVLMNNR